METPLIKRAKWYVYELVNPCTGKVFYVGKGAGDRINAHEREARSRRRRQINQSKVDEIRSIWKVGKDLQKRKVAYFWCELAAYQCEAARIQEYEDLTNIVNGTNRNPKMLSFFNLLADVIVRGSQESLGKMVKYFPRDRLPMQEHKQLWDAAVNYGRRA